MTCAADVESSWKLHPRIRLWGESRVEFTGRRHPDPEGLVEFGKEEATTDGSQSQLPRPVMVKGYPPEFPFWNGFWGNVPMGWLVRGSR